MTGDFAPDVLVVGLGPAGASAALAAAQAGARVMAVERNSTPGLPVQCAEFVPGPVFDQVPQGGTARVQPIGRMVTRVEDEAPEVTEAFRGQMIDRALFDQTLIARALAAGAECHFGRGLRAIGPGGVTLANGDVIVPHVIIGADGPLSQVGRAIGCINTALVDTRQITLDLLQAHDATDIFLRKDFPGGYGWLFPKGAVCNLGLGVQPSHRLRLKALLTALHAELVASGRVGNTILRVTGGLIPVGGIVGLRGRLGTMRVLLAGDAAGLTHPVTGAGIAAAVASGHMAGETAAALLADQENAARDYEDEIRAVYGTAYAHALNRRHGLLASAASLHDLRTGWIAYPQYWNKDPAPAPGTGHDITLEATI